MSPAKAGRKASTSRTPTQNPAADFTERTLASDSVYRGGFFEVCRDKVRRPDGKPAVREYIRHPGAVMMVPLLDENTVLLVRQFRYPLRRHFIEVPAGKMEPGEDPLATAKRELTEECGYEAARWRHLATLHPCIGYSDERIELYLARELRHVGAGPDDGEFLEVLPTPIDQALKWVREGRITEVKAIIGLMWLERFLGRGPARRGRPLRSRA
ncbi:MAG: NUDIX domain-containing protein [Betaproteobacteria bacterium]